MNTSLRKLRLGEADYTEGMLEFEPQDETPFPHKEVTFLATD